MLEETFGGGVEVTHKQCFYSRQMVPAFGVTKRMLVKLQTSSQRLEAALGIFLWRHHGTMERPGQSDPSSFRLGAFATIMLLFL